jgi:hypothetical protein
MVKWPTEEWNFIYEGLFFLKYRFFRPVGVPWS